MCLQLHICTYAPTFPISSLAVKSCWSHGNHLWQAQPEATLHHTHTIAQTSLAKQSKYVWHWSQVLPFVIVVVFSTHSGCLHWCLLCSPTSSTTKHTHFTQTNIRSTHHQLSQVLVELKQQWVKRALNLFAKRALDHPHFAWLPLHAATKPSMNE